MSTRPLSPRSTDLSIGFGDESRIGEKMLPILRGHQQEHLMNRRRYVYSLCDPRTEIICYIGVTIDLTTRFNAHIYWAKRAMDDRKNPASFRKTLWLRELISLGILPIINVLQTTETASEAIAAERYWIKHYQSEYLTNGTAGGDLGGNRTKTLQDRVIDYFIPEPFSGCWLWVGPLTKKGYGRHRLSYQAFKGEIPIGMQLDHKCRVRCCVNPDHLEPVTLVENVKRGQSGSFHRNKTECPAGHPYDESNTGKANGERYCKECRNGTRREKRKERGAKPRRVPIACNGENHYLKAWARISGIHYSVISGRLDRGWPVARAIFEASTKHRKQSPEAIAKRIKANTGKKRTPEQIDRMQRARNPHLYARLP